MTFCPCRADRRVSVIESGPPQWLAATVGLVRECGIARRTRLNPAAACVLPVAGIVTPVLSRHRGPSLLFPARERTIRPATCPEDISPFQACLKEIARSFLLPRYDTSSCLAFCPDVYLPGRVVGVGLFWSCLLASVAVIEPFSIKLPAVAVTMAVDTEVPWVINVWLL